MAFASVPNTDLFAEARQAIGLAKVVRQRSASVKGPFNRKAASTSAGKVKKSKLKKDKEVEKVTGRSSKTKTAGLKATVALDIGIKSVTAPNYDQEDAEMAVQNYQQTKQVVKSLDATTEKLKQFEEYANQNEMFDLSEPVRKMVDLAEEKQTKLSNRFQEHSDIIHRVASMAQKGFEFVSNSAMVGLGGSAILQATPLAQQVETNRQEEKGLIERAKRGVGAFFAQLMAQRSQAPIDIPLLTQNPAFQEALEVNEKKEQIEKMKIDNQNDLKRKREEIDLENERRVKVSFQGVPVEGNIVERKSRGLKTYRTRETELEQLKDQLQWKQKNNVAAEQINQETSQAIQQIQTNQEQVARDLTALQKEASQEIDNHLNELQENLMAVQKENIKLGQKFEKMAEQFAKSESEGQQTLSKTVETVMRDIITPEIRKEITNAKLNLNNELAAAEQTTKQLDTSLVELVENKIKDLQMESHLALTEAQKTTQAAVDGLKQLDAGFKQFALANQKAFSNEALWKERNDIAANEEREQSIRKNERDKIQLDLVQLKLQQQNDLMIKQAEIEALKQERAQTTSGDTGAMLTSQLQVKEQQIATMTQFQKQELAAIQQQLLKLTQVIENQKPIVIPAPTTLPTFQVPALASQYDDQLQMVYRRKEEDDLAKAVVAQINGQVNSLIEAREALSLAHRNEMAIEIAKAQAASLEIARLKIEKMVEDAGIQITGLLSTIPKQIEIPPVQIVRTVNELNEATAQLDQVTLNQTIATLRTLYQNQLEKHILEQKLAHTEWSGKALVEIRDQLNLMVPLLTTDVNKQLGLQFSPLVKGLSQVEIAIGTTTTNMAVLQKHVTDLNASVASWEAAATRRQQSIETKLNSIDLAVKAINTNPEAFIDLNKKLLYINEILISLQTKSVTEVISIDQLELIKESILQEMTSLEPTISRIDTNVIAGFTHTTNQIQALSAALENSHAETKAALALLNNAQQAIDQMNARCEAVLSRTSAPIEISTGPNTVIDTNAIVEALKPHLQFNCPPEGDYQWEEYPRKRCKFKTVHGYGVRERGWKRCMNEQSLDAIGIL